MRFAPSIDEGPSTQARRDVEAAAPAALMPRVECLKASEGGGLILVLPAVLGPQRPDAEGGIEGDGQGCARSETDFGASSSSEFGKKRRSIKTNAARGGGTPGEGVGQNGARQVKFARCLQAAVRASPDRLAVCRSSKLDFRDVDVRRLQKIFGGVRFDTRACADVDRTYVGGSILQNGVFADEDHFSRGGENDRGTGHEARGRQCERSYPDAQARHRTIIIGVIPDATSDEA